MLLDVIMPRKSGKEAFEEIRAIQPDIKALFFSGYTEDIIQRKRIMEEKLPLLQKPVKPHGAAGKNQRGPRCALNGGERMRGLCH